MARYLSETKAYVIQLIIKIYVEEYNTNIVLKIRNDFIGTEECGLSEG